MELTAQCRLALNLESTPFSSGATGTAHLPLFGLSLGFPRDFSLEVIWILLLGFTSSDLLFLQFSLPFDLQQSLLLPETMALELISGKCLITVEE